MKRFPVYAAALVVLIIVFFSSAAGTLAAWTAERDTVNKITIGSIKGLVSMEGFSYGQVIMPGTTAPNVVSVKNTGTIDVLVRLKMDIAWGSSRDSERKLTVIPSLSTDNIHITFNSTNWYFKQADGYFYYRGVVRPGESTIPLMKEFTIDSNSGNKYKNMMADFVVHMECIQAAGEGPKVWGLDSSVLSVSRSGTAIIAEVEFLNPTDGFRFKSSDGDLFVNFKDLIPGESQSQVIKITNSYTQKTEIFLKADYTDQAHTTPENRELIERLLKEYAVITISNAAGEVLYRGPIWGNLDVDSHGTDSAKYYISLGNFDSQTSGKLTVNLSLDSAMDNKYQNALGLIKWTFAAEGRESAYTSVVAKTGESTEKVLSISLLLLSGSLLSLLLVKRKRRAEQ